MSRVVEAVAKSLALAAINRILIPLILIFVAWYAREIVDLKQRLTMVEMSRTSDREALKIQIDAIDRRREQDAQMLTQLQQDLARQQIVLSSLTATAQATKEGVERIYRQIDAGLLGSAPLTRRPTDQPMGPTR